MAGMRKYLSIQGLLLTVQKSFAKISDVSHRSDKTNISLVDCLMSGLAVFGLKYPSLLKFDSEKSKPPIKKNLSTLYGVKQAPCDTYLRERLDPILPEKIRPAFKSIFALLQRGKALEPYQYFEGAYLLSVDGTGQYYSDKVHCEECCEKHHRNGNVSYYHQMLGAVIVHPKQSIVIPLAPEPITKQDGANKNDCERNAAKRLLQNIRREHPHLKLIVTEDGLSSNGPHIQLLKSLGMRFILGVKPDDHSFLFDWILNSKCEEHEEVDQNGTKHHYKFINNVPLNDANFDLQVNFLEYWEIKPNGSTQHFSWVTDILINKKNVGLIMRGGRARWKIENETFTTLKNQGYNFEHNYGHGNKHLCSVFTMLMILAFLIDQAQALCCHLFRAAKKVARTNRELWQEMRTLFKYFIWDSWEVFYTAIANVPSLEMRLDTT
jgi:hypothetical protein